jgi:hypothetical protein
LVILSMSDVPLMGVTGTVGVVVEVVVLILGASMTVSSSLTQEVSAAINDAPVKPKDFRNS